MEPLEIIAVIDAALTIAEKLSPLVQQAVAQGQITPEQQAALKARIDKLRDNTVSFSGPEWKG